VSPPKSGHLVSVSAMLFDNKIFADVMKLRRGHWGES
jgi:hypothetical protein